MLSSSQAVSQPDTARLPTGEMTTSDLQRYISVLGNLQKDNISRKKLSRF